MEKFYSCEEVANMLGVKERTVWKWCRNNTLPYCDFGKKLYRITESSVKNFIERRSK